MGTSSTDIHHGASVADNDTGEPGAGKLARPVRRGVSGKGPQTRDLAGHLPYYVLRQASRRSWRIGQRQPVEVTFLAYAGTLQAEALGLVAAKTRASLMIEGELPEEGLAALDGDGSDVYLALARRLAAPAVGVATHAQSLEALFAEAHRDEEFADGLLIAGRWDDEPEPASERTVFPVANGAPASPPSLVAMLSKGDPATSVAPAPGVVTLEELAQLVRPRRRRPKPVPAGQLALLGD